MVLRNKSGERDIEEERERLVGFVGKIFFLRVGTFSNEVGKEVNWEISGRSFSCS